METFPAVVLGAMIAVVATLAQRLLEHFLQKDRDRSQFIWKARFDECIRIESEAGLLMERLSIPRISADPETEAALKRLTSHAPVVRRDTKATQSVRDFVHQCQILLSDNWETKIRERQQEVAELRRLYDALIRELDAFLGTLGRDRRAG